MKLQTGIVFPDEHLVSMPLIISLVSGESFERRGDILEKLEHDARRQSAYKQMRQEKA
jgi:hypothetical protein